MPLRPGARFGRYELSATLGKGGMGEVYSAYDTVLHRNVALKVLTSPPAAPDRKPDEAEAVSGEPVSGLTASRILREARAAAGLAHPNAVAIYDVGEVEGIPFLAMELVPGRTLRALIGDRSLSLGRRLRWIIDIARALGAAHALNLVHRDIKPENVMIRDDGLVKVLDFGIARRTVTKEEAATLSPPDLAALTKLGHTSGTITTEGVVLGTPMYMAPEQLTGDALDGRTDEFSWAVLAYELLGGKLPWDAGSSEMFSQILSRDPGPLSELRPEIPSGVEATIRRALSKSPAARFPTILEAADELEPFAGMNAAEGASDDAFARAALGVALAPTEEVSVPLAASDAERAVSAPLAPVRPGPVRAGLLVLLALGIGVASVLGVRGFLRGRAPAVTHADAAPADEPSQLSSKPEAVAAYRAGLQALRDGSLSGALKQLNQATELDPLFAAAHLRRSLTRLLGNYSGMITSADLEGARTSQSYLGTHDRTLLTAFELLAETPPDFAASERILDAAAKAAPSDADFPFQRGLVLDLAQRQSEASAAFESSIARDPSFAFGWRMKARVLTELDDVPGATHALAKCLEVSPIATTCLADVAAIETNDGECEDLVRTSRRGIGLLPASPLFYFWLAQGLAGTGAPPEAVRAALKQTWDRQPAAATAFAEPFAEASLAILAGDFAAAERRYDEAEKLVSAGNDRTSAFSLAYQRVLLDIEAGRMPEALRRAKAYVRQSAGLATNKDFGGYDYSLFMQAAELQMDAIKRPEYDALRDAWLARNGDKDPGYRWINAYALAVRTPDEAKAALLAMPPAPLSILVRAPNLGEPLGRTFALAGRVAEGTRYLESAGASCNVLDGVQAVYATWALADRARALDEHGDVAGACTAYGRVLSRWGGASRRMPSRTAATARARSAALGCK